MGPGPTDTYYHKCHQERGLAFSFLPRELDRHSAQYSVTSWTSRAVVGALQAPVGGWQLAGPACNPTVAPWAASVTQVHSRPAFGEKLVMMNGLNFPAWR